MELPQIGNTAAARTRSCGCKFLKLQRSNQAEPESSMEESNFKNSPYLL